MAAAGFGSRIEAKTRTTESSGEPPSEGTAVEAKARIVRSNLYVFMANTSRILSGVRSGGSSSPTQKGNGVRDSGVFSSIDRVGFPNGIKSRAGLP